MLDGQAPLLEAARILTALQVSAVMVLDNAATRQVSQYKAITGYSILSHLPFRGGSFSELFSRPGMYVGRRMRVVKETDTIESVVKAIRESHLGVVLIAGKRGGSKVLSTVELRDFIRLYRDGYSLPDSNVKIGELSSSPILSVKNGSTLKDIITSMLKFKVRKILLSETKRLVSDRDVLSFITSPGTLERMERSKDEVLKTSAIELPSTRPPTVDSRMTITEAAQLMNPDSGDCLVCDSGLVTFWDLVVTLEHTRRNSAELLQQSDPSVPPVFGRTEAEKTEKPGRIIESAANVMSRSEKLRFSALTRKIQQQGFIGVDDVPRFARRKLVDPIYFNQPARPFHIMGVCSGRKGAIRFSAVNLFGLRMLDESYYVSDWDRFSQFMSQKLEVMFRSANPKPSRGMKVAFTRFLHNFGLHWTDCGHAKIARRAVIAE